MQPNDSTQEPVSAPDLSAPDLSATSDPEPSEPKQGSSDSNRLSAVRKSSEPIVPFSLTPVEALQKRYADQLSQDIEALEEKKTQLKDDIQTLTRAYTRLQASIESLREAERAASKSADAARQRASETMDSAEDAEASEGSSVEGSDELSTEDEFVRPSLMPSPRLPGEPNVPDRVQVSSAVRDSRSGSRSGGRSGSRSGSRSIELPIPATSKQRRQLSIQSRHVDRVDSAAIARKGFILSAIATLLVAWHFCAISTLSTGGSWLGITIGTLGNGFMPAVALLWLRMLVFVPALVLLAPQLHEAVWTDLRDWTYKRDGLLLLLIGSGIALFMSQTLLYQALGLVGGPIGATLLFLYPLVAAPLNALGRKLWKSGSGSARSLSALSALALVAIAMGSILTLKSALQLSPSSIWLGLAASVAFSIYSVLTHISYRQPNCHPIPAGLIQFSVVAALSSMVLLVKPLEPVDIDWLSFALWGILLGFVMLLAYLFNYSSFRLIGPRSAIFTAAAPIATLLIALSFDPAPALATIQWTGIALVGIGGVAIAKENAAH